MVNKVLSLLFCVLSTAVFAETSADAIVGTWINQAGDGVIKISRDGEHYIGTIVAGTHSDRHSRKDINNPDPKLKSRTLKGLTILGGLIFDGDDEWDDGWVYDPNNGKTYSCSVSLRDRNTLALTGYVGFSLFGRTDLWKRRSGG